MKTNCQTVLKLCVQSVCVLLTAILLHTLVTWWEPCDLVVPFRAFGSIIYLVGNLKGPLHKLSVQLFQHVELCIYFDLMVFISFALSVFHCIWIYYIYLFLIYRFIVVLHFVVSCCMYDVFPRSIHIPALLAINTWCVARCGTSFMSM